MEQTQVSFSVGFLSILDKELALLEAYEPNTEKYELYKQKSQAIKTLPKGLKLDLERIDTLYDTFEVLKLQYLATTLHNFTLKQIIRELNEIHKNLLEYNINYIVDDILKTIEKCKRDYCIENNGDPDNVTMVIFLDAMSEIFPIKEEEGTLRFDFEDTQSEDSDRPPDTIKPTKLGKQEILKVNLDTMSQSSDGSDQPIPFTLGDVDDSDCAFEDIFVGHLKKKDIAKLAELENCAKAISGYDFTRLPEDYETIKFIDYYLEVAKMKKLLSENGIHLYLGKLDKYKKKSTGDFTKQFKNTKLGKLVDQLEKDYELEALKPPKTKEKKVIDTLKEADLITFPDDHLWQFEDWSIFSDKSKKRTLTSVELDLFYYWMEKTIAYISNGGKSEFITISYSFDKYENNYKGEREEKWNININHVSIAQMNSTFLGANIRYLTKEQQREIDKEPEEGEEEEEEPEISKVPIFILIKNEITSGKLKVNSADFIPTDEPIPKTFNFFTGFRHKYDPNFVVDPSKFRYIQKHLRKVWANNNMDHFMYIESWFAHLIQDPTFMHGVALYIESLPGVGKTCIGEFFRDCIIGYIYTHISSNKEDFFGNFNASTVHKLLGVLEEINLRDKKSINRMKQLGTTTRNSVTFKGKDAKMMRTYMHLLLFGNPDEQENIQVVYKDRRMACFRANSKYIKDDTIHKTYMDKLYSQFTLEAGLHYFHYLKRFKIDECPITSESIPDTDLRKELKLQSIPLIIQFFLALIEGRVDKYVPKNDKDEKCDIGIYGHALEEGTKGKRILYPYLTSELLEKYNIFLRSNKQPTISSQKFNKEITRYNLADWPENATTACIMYYEDGTLFEEEKPTNGRWLKVNVTRVLKAEEDVLNDELIETTQDTEDDNSESEVKKKAKKIKETKPRLTTPTVEIKNQVARQLTSEEVTKIGTITKPRSTLKGVPIDEALKPKAKPKVSKKQIESEEEIDEEFENTKANTTDILNRLKKSNKLKK